MSKTGKLWSVVAIFVVVSVLAGPLAMVPVVSAEDPETKVAFVYVAPIGDMGWTYAHDLGRLMLEEELGVETAYIENVPEGPDAERVIRDYAQKGYDVILAGFIETWCYFDPFFNFVHQQQPGETPDMVEQAKSTLILTTSVTALRQWHRELVERTSLTDEQVGEYSGADKRVAPVTVATYQILTHRRSRDKPFTHFELFRRRNWGLIIYDEVHLLPAPVFRILADIQGRRRLGLTATLVREDGREDEVFSLIGPKKYDVPWRELEQQGFIAAASCVEVRVSPDADLRRRYYAASDREAFVLAATNPAKDAVVAELLERHRGEKVLVIGHYLSQLRQVAASLNLPVLTGSTPQGERERLYGQFRDGELPVLVVSKVANFAVDLPAASVAIQISGTFGSRQEEAQRLGRILRPKGGANQAWFYTLVTRDTVEVEYARRRQIFLAEQGYSYQIEGAVQD